MVDGGDQVLWCVAIVVSPTGVGAVREGSRQPGDAGPVRPAGPGRWSGRRRQRLLAARASRPRTVPLVRGQFYEPPLDLLPPDEGRALRRRQMVDLVPTSGSSNRRRAKQHGYERQRDSQEIRPQESKRRCHRGGRLAKVEELTASLNANASNARKKGANGEEGARKIKWAPEVVRFFAWPGTTAGPGKPGPIGIKLRSY